MKPWITFLWTTFVLILTSETDVVRQKACVLCTDITKIESALTDLTRRRPMMMCIGPNTSLDM